MFDRRGIDRRGLGPTPASYIARMGARDRMGTRLNDTDLEFVVAEASGAASAGPSGMERLKQLVLEDQDFRKAMIGDEKVFQKVIGDQEVFLKISPALYFEVLLRRAHSELQAASYTLERSGKQNIPVFDTRDVVELLAHSEVLEYLAQMLGSFTRVNSYVRPVRVRRGIWRRVRYNDMDVDSLISLCSEADEENRLGLYKRIADVCLFISGIFHENTFFVYRQGAPVHSSARRMRRSMEDYEWEGRRFYSLAEKHPAASSSGLSEVFGILRERFVSARKPLNFIAAQYMHSAKGRLFGVPEQ